MGLHYVIDGYNLIKSTPALNKSNLCDSRQALLNLLDIHRPQGNNKVSVVFDGKDGVFSSQKKSCAQVIFTKNQSADDKIKEIIQASRNPANIVVVTNDRDIRFFARQYSAGFKSVEEFLSKFNSKSPPLLDEGKKPLSAFIEADITEEMRRIWLK